MKSIQIVLLAIYATAFVFIWIHILTSNTMTGLIAYSSLGIASVMAILIATKKHK